MISVVPLLRQCSPNYTTMAWENEVWGLPLGDESQALNSARHKSHDYITFQILQSSAHSKSGDSTDRGKIRRCWHATLRTPPCMLLYSMMAAVRTIGSTVGLHWLSVILSLYRSHSCTASGHCYAGLQSFSSYQHASTHCHEH